MSFFKVRRSLGKGGRKPPRYVRHKNFFVEQSCFRSAFSQFFPPRAPPSRPPEPLTKQLPPLSPAFFVYRPTTSNSNLAPVVALTFGKADVSRKSPAFITAQALPHEQIVHSAFASQQVPPFKTPY